MTAEHFGEDRPRPIPGFRSFADEDDRFEDDYGAADPGDARPASVRGGRAALLVGGLLCAALAVGAVSWSGLSRLRASPPSSEAKLPVQVTQPPTYAAAPPVPAAPPASSERGEPLNAIPASPASSPERLTASPPGPAISAAPRAAPALPEGPPAAVQPPPPLVRAEPPAPELAPVPARSEAEEPRPAFPPAARLPGALDCANVASPAQDIACRDPGLRAADRRMARAYSAALAAGAPEGRLRRDQVEWLNMREDAARYSKQALENSYHQRIQELEALADEPPP